MWKNSKTNDVYVQYIQRTSSFVYAVPEFTYQVTDIQNIGILTDFLSSEKNRLHTFTSYPLDGISAIVLAADGFIYQKNGYEVMCIYCGVRNSSWNTWDNVHEIHGQLSPRCPVVTGVYLNNIRIHNCSSNRVDLEGLRYRHQVQADQDQGAEQSRTNERAIQESLPVHVEQTIVNENALTFNSEYLHPSVDISNQEESNFEFGSVVNQNHDTIISLQNSATEDSTIEMSPTSTSIENNLKPVDANTPSSSGCDCVQDVSLTSLHENLIHNSSTNLEHFKSLESQDIEPVLQELSITNSSDNGEPLKEYILTLKEGQNISEITVSLNNSSENELPIIKTSSEGNSVGLHLRISSTAHYTSRIKIQKAKEKNELQKDDEALIRNLRQDKLKLKTFPDEDKQEADLRKDPAVKHVVAMGYKEEDVLRIANFLAEKSLPMSSDAILEKLKLELKQTLTKEQFVLSEAIRKMKESYSILQPLLQEYHTSH